MVPRFVLRHLCRSAPYSDMNIAIQKHFICEILHNYYNQIGLICKVATLISKLMDSRIRKATEKSVALGNACWVESVTG
jgi:hypothetical protein